MILNHTMTTKKEQKMANHRLSYINQNVKAWN